VIDGCAELETVTDALEAELWLANNVCTIRGKAPDDDAFQLAMLDLVDEAERDGRRQCLLLLRTMAAAGPQEAAEPATDAASRLTGRMSPEAAAGLPEWVTELGEVTVVGDCSVWADAFGEYLQVFCEYAHAGGGRRHGLLFTVDMAFRGVMHSVVVVVAPKELDQVVPDMKRDARRDGGRFERVPTAEAGGVLRAALAALADPMLPSLRTAARNDSLSTMLPSAARRVLAMPGERPGALPRERVAAMWPAQRRQALVEEFLAAHQGKWADARRARMFAARIVDASVDALGFPPDRIGPSSVARLFGEVLPGSVIIPRPLLDLSQQVAQAWVRWRTKAQDPPRAARRQLRRTAHAVLTLFPSLCLNPRFNRFAPYVADAPAVATDGAVLQEILDRRWFAVPLPGQRGDGLIDIPEPVNDLSTGHKHVDELDAAHPTHRHLITAVGQAAQGTQTHRIPAYAAIVEQLWNNQPAAVWQTAAQLSATGLPRQQVLDRLARAWERHGPATDTDDLAPGPDTDSYIAALHALGAAAVPRGRE